ncbi:hypothetical protein [Streptomyces sp. ME18-1-4]|uniref:hypothetical protein n=1 Tax=Streptomyces sp. ME18-1-4 TaxID=3028685 RepID=UPI0029A8E369|nr:hypothetical protein [Streptomyces sp. ME18-1-4]MDX3241571.1 hypothetical protein [Streptomyces sp. ME18-1-4]
MSPAAPRRAQRWFWTLATLAVCAAGALYEGLRAAPGPGTGLRVLVSGLVLAASVVQAARILAALASGGGGENQRAGREAVPHTADENGHQGHAPATGDQ